MEVVFIYAVEILYVIILIAVCLRVIIKTRTPAKALAYLLLIIFIPVIGMIIYFFFGTNYRKSQLYSKKLTHDQALLSEVEARVRRYTEENLEEYSDILQGSEACIRFLVNDTLSPLTSNNYTRLLFNGEEKFETMIEAMERAKHHIHMEYYIIEEGETLNQVKEVLKRKAADGVKVRIIYDDYGSHSLRFRTVPELTEAGIEIYPFHKVRFIWLANRLNYRNHRKIIMIDGREGFVGGINISDRYNNSTGPSPYWRDTHLQIRGPGVFKLQFLFFTSWRFCSGQELEVSSAYFPVEALLTKNEEVETENSEPSNPGDDYSEESYGDGNSLVQIASGGPDSPQSTILLTTMDAVASARHRLLITTPYFLPDDSLLKTLQFSALSGVDVRLIVPGRTDSWLVNAAAHSFYGEMLDAGVRIYLYQKGMIHAKTMLVDDHLSVIGTANMDQRSFDLNFEVNAMVYDFNINQELTDHFRQDLDNSEEIIPETWNDRPSSKQYAEAVARLFSPLM